MDKILLTRREAAALIGISTASVEQLTKSNQLPVVKVGRSVRIHIEDLQAFARTGTKNRTVTGAPLDASWAAR